MEDKLSTRSQRFAWCLYDFANSAFPTVIVTAIYVIYFKDHVVGAGKAGESDSLWGIANSVGAAIVFLTAPVLGAIADVSGKKQHFLIGFAVLCIVATGGLYFTGPGTVALAMGLFIAALVGFEGSTVFYNAFLPQLVEKDKMERLSGTAWGLGYIGGLGALFACLPLVLIAKRVDLVPLAVAGWFAIFAIYPFVKLKDKGGALRRAGDPSYVAMGVNQLIGTFKEIKKHSRLLRFLGAYFFYNNAVVTIIVFSVAFSRDTLFFSMTENILLISLMNIVAAPGAFFFGRVAQKVGAKRTIIITLFMWLVVILGAEISAWPGLFSVAEAKMFFWGVSALASLCIGAIQATSRTFVGQLAPDGHAGEFFGFMAFAGKGSAILGPLVFGLISNMFDSQRAALLSIAAFFLIGLLLISTLKDE